MANIKFFRKDVAPSNPQEGYVWFNSSNNTIQLYKNSAWEVYTGKINDVTYADGKLTIVPHVGDSTTIDLGAVANISDLSTRLGTLETNFNTLSGEFATEKGKISTLEGTVNTHSQAIASLIGKFEGITGTVKAAIEEEAAVRLEEDGKLQDAIDVEKGRIDDLVESVANAEANAKAYVDGIVNDTTNEDGIVVKGLNSRVSALESIDHEQLASDASAAAVATILDNAPASFDTLKEVADWIANNDHADDVAGLMTDVENLKKIDHDAYKAADTALETSLKGYVDGKVDGKFDTAGAADTALASAKSYTDELANGAVATNTSDIADLKAAVETINTTIEENELTVASALTDLDTRINSLASGTVSSVSGENHIYVETTDGAVVISAVTGTVASGAATLAVASDVKAYVDSA